VLYPSIAIIFVGRIAFAAARLGLLGCIMYTVFRMIRNDRKENLKRIGKGGCVGFVFAIYYCVIFINVFEHHFDMILVDS
jgi:hypothetical protein